MIASDIAPPPGVAVTNDWRALGDVTTEAFRADPFNMWLHGGRSASMRAVFRSLARHIYARRGYCLIAGGGLGAAMWMPPGKTESLPRTAFTALGLSLLLRGGPGALRRTLAAGAAMDAAKPRTPHMYLFTIGTIASARGAGLGKAMLAPVLAACDRAGMPAYLENSNPANHGFYAAHGFESRGLIRTLPGAPPLEAMWREAKG